MPDQPTRHLAEKIMRSAIADIDLPAVHRALHDTADGPGVIRVAEAIRTAVVTVTWPGEILATIRTTEPEAAAQDITALLLNAGYDVDVTHG